MRTDQDPNFDGLMSAINDARRGLSVARDAEETARTSATDCLNRLNQAEAAFDQAVLQVRNSAPKGSDWKIGTRRPPP